MRKNKRTDSQYRVGMDRGIAYIVSAPAGTGKTTLVKKLTKEFPSAQRSITYTTRPKRASEEHGKDYYFVSFQEFEKKIEKKEFLEYAQVFGHFYGTCKKSIEKLLEQGYDTILVIDTQGALEIKPFFKGVYIFLSPPSLEELKKRLTRRKTESPSDLETRLRWAHEELKQSAHYDYHLVNQDLKQTYDEFRSIYLAERLKKRSIHYQPKEHYEEKKPNE